MKHRFHVSIAGKEIPPEKWDARTRNLVLFMDVAPMSIARLPTEDKYAQLVIKKETP